MRALCAMALVLAACGGKSQECAPATFAGAPFLSLASDANALRIAVRTSPQPPGRDCNDVQYVVTDASDAGVPGLSLAVVPWMPAMGHGASVQPTVTDQGGGVYLLNDVYLPMPGTWELRTTFSGAVSDHATPSFQVP